MNNYNIDNSLGKRSFSSFFYHTNSELTLQFAKKIQLLLSEDINSMVLSKQLLVAVKQECHGRRFSKKHNHVQASFILTRSLDHNIIKITVVDHTSKLGSGGFKCVKKGVEILFCKETNTVVNTQNIAIIRDKAKVSSEILNSSRLFYKRATKAEANQSLLRIVPPPKEEEIYSTQYENSSKKYWFTQSLAEGDLNSVPLARKEKLQIFLDFIPTLKFFQNKKLSYGDWSPDNILIFKENDQCIGKIADWDLLEAYTTENGKENETNYHVFNDSLKKEYGYTTSITDLYKFWKCLFNAFLQPQQSKKDQGVVAISLYDSFSFQEFIDTHKEIGSQNIDEDLFHTLYLLNQEVKKQDQALYELITSGENNEEYLEVIFSEQERFQELLYEDFPLLTIIGIEEKLLELQQIFNKLK